MTRFGRALQALNIDIICANSSPAKGRVERAHKTLQDRLAIRSRGVELAYRTFDKIRQVGQGAIVENKRLGAALALIREEQLRREPQRRSGPRRRDQRDARLFKVG
jgi:hypothetical protein